MNDSAEQAGGQAAWQRLLQGVLEYADEATRAPLTAIFTDFVEAEGEAELLVNRLERFIHKTISPASELRYMAEAPRYAALVLTVLRQSSFLTDIICRNPEYMTWVWSDGNLEEARPAASMTEELWEQMQAFGDMTGKFASMRRFRRREILRIACRDIFHHAPLPSVAEDLANLADAALEAACRAAHDELRARYGVPMTADTEQPEQAGVTVIGMGKLGGRELNFSSDIDLLFVYEDEGRTTGGEREPITNAEYFQKWGERLVKGISEITAEGNVFRVDMRLRPFGADGPLAASLESTLDYYTRYGQTWERQALIKARPCAGDMELGGRFLIQARPFAYPRYFDDDMLENVRNTKAQMEALVAQRGQTLYEVKLGRGGIRDIEFTVQMLQMLNGGRIEELRTQNTLEAIVRLGETARIKPFEAQTLASNYVFLRQVEHRLQIEGSRQVHCLPSDPAERDAFAKRLGYTSGESFMNDYGERAEQTRAVLERFLAVEGAGNLWVRDLLNHRSSAEQGISQLEHMGFSDPAAARRMLLDLCNGKPAAPHSLHVRQRFTEIAPLLLREIAACSNPQQVLMRFAELLEKTGAPASVYDMLRTNETLIGHFTRLIDNSSYLTTILLRDIGLFETIGHAEALSVPATAGHIREVLVQLRGAYEPEAAPYRLRDGELLRIGMREIFMEADVIEISRELSNLAEVILQDAVETALEKAARKYGETEARFCVAALGKFGGCEMGYGSDLDVIFVYEPGKPIQGGMSPLEYFIYVGTQIVNPLKETSRYGIPLYEIDTRLRPYGSKGSLAVPLDRMLEYYENEAESWEHLAMVKVRAVAGDPAFGREVETSLREMAFSKALQGEGMARIEELRRRHAEQATRFDLKQREGGISELELGVRLLQVIHAPEHPTLKRGDVTGALDTLAQAGILPAEEAEALGSAYRFYRRVENRIRMAHGRSESALPAQDEERALLARRLGIEDDLLELTQQNREIVHAFYEQAKDKALAQSGAA